MRPLAAMSLQVGAVILVPIVALGLLESYWYATGQCRFSDSRDPYQAVFLRMIPPFRVRISQNLSPL